MAFDVAPAHIYNSLYAKEAWMRNMFSWLCIINAVHVAILSLTWLHRWSRGVSPSANLLYSLNLLFAGIVSEGERCDLAHHAPETHAHAHTHRFARVYRLCFGECTRHALCQVWARGLTGSRSDPLC